jgi:hypothetical protein
VSARALLALVAAAAGLAATSGCNANLSKREMVVHFTPSATAAQHRAARAACATAAPDVSPEPIVHTKFASTLVDDVRFRVDHADDKDLSLLYACLQKQPGVLGVDDPMDMTR